MNRQKVFLWLLVCIGAIVLLSGVSQAIGASGYAIKWSAVVSSGGAAQSPSFVINANAGQANVGQISGTSYQVGTGYWYGIDGEVYAIYLPLVIRD
jgi:hypothetical protein